MEYGQCSTVLPAGQRCDRNAMHKGACKPKGGTVSAWHFPPGSVPRLRDALRVATAHGCTLSYRGGEVIVRAPDRTRVVVNNRRADASRALLLMLRRL